MICWGVGFINLQMYNKQLIRMKYCQALWVQYGKRIHMYKIKALWFTLLFQYNAKATFFLFIAQESSPSDSCDWTAETFKKKKIKLQGTKKKGCEATMDITEVEIFPEYSVSASKSFEISH